MTYPPVPAYARDAITAHPTLSNSELAAKLGKSPQTIATYRTYLRREGVPLPPVWAKPRPIDVAAEELSRGRSARAAAKAQGITEKALWERIRRRDMQIADVRGAWVVSFADLCRMLGYATTSAKLRHRLRAAGAPIARETTRKRRSRIFIDLTEFVGWAATESGRKAIDMERIADQELREAIEQERAL